SADGHEAADERGVEQGHASGGEGALGGAAHVAVNVVLDDFVEGGGATRNESDTKQGVEQSPGKGSDAAGERAEIIAAPRGHDDESGDAHLGEFGVVASAGCEGAARDGER